MSPRPLPRNPNLKLLNAEAKNLLRDLRQGNALASARYFLSDVRLDTSKPRLADAQRVLARESVYASWLKRKRHVEALAGDSCSAEEL